MGGILIPPEHRGKIFNTLPTLGGTTVSGVVWDNCIWDDVPCTKKSLQVNLFS